MELYASGLTGFKTKCVNYVTLIRNCEKYA